jgi:hypothetical protein
VLNVNIAYLIFRVNFIEQILFRCPILFVRFNFLSRSQRHFVVLLELVLGQRKVRLRSRGALAVELIVLCMPTIVARRTDAMNIVRAVVDDALVRAVVSVSLVGTFLDRLDDMPSTANNGLDTPACILEPRPFTFHVSKDGIHHGGTLTPRGAYVSNLGHVKHGATYASLLYVLIKDDVGKRTTAMHQLILFFDRS